MIASPYAMLTTDQNINEYLRLTTQPIPEHSCKEDNHAGVGEEEKASSLEEERGKEVAFSRSP